MRDSSQTQLNQNRWYILKLEQKTTCFGQKWPSSGLLQKYLSLTLEYFLSKPEKYKILKS
jgi:hypothetical protein